MLERDTRSRVVSDSYEQFFAGARRGRNETGHDSAPAQAFDREEAPHCRGEFAPECLGGSRGAGAWRERQPSVFWRKLYQQGLLGPTRPQAALLPVQIADPVGQQILPALTGRVDQPQPSPAVSAAGAIYLELPKAQLRIEGAADPAVLRTLLDCLLG